MHHYADDDWTEDNRLEPRRRGFDGVQVLALAGALALIAAPAIQAYARRRRLRYPTALSEPAIDKTLKDTYPASDPPASRYFDIPENRR